MALKLDGCLVDAAILLVVLLRIAEHEIEIFEERIEESNHIGGPLTVLVPEERRVVRTEREIRSDREIQDEIRRANMTQ